MKFERKEKAMLEDQITNDYKQAMKDKDSLRVSTISFLRSQFKYAMIDKRVEKLDDEQAIFVIKKQIKQRQDSIEQFKNGNRADLVAKEEKELAILKGYLPQEMPESELKALIEEAIKVSGASSIKDMGNVMKVVLGRVAGRTDNKRVSDLVREQLASM